MTAIVCDICKKPVSAARREVNYWVLLDKDICEPCRDELYDACKHHMRARTSYAFAEYQDVLKKNLLSMAR